MSDESKNKIMAEIDLLETTIVVINFSVYALNCKVPSFPFLHLFRSTSRVSRMPTNPFLPTAHDKSRERFKLKFFSSFEQSTTFLYNF